MTKITYKAFKEVNYHRSSASVPTSRSINIHFILEIKNDLFSVERYDYLIISCVIKEALMKSQCHEFIIQMISCL